jgi:hypothetical protein
MLPGLGAQAAFAVVQRQGEALRARFEARRDNQAEAARFRETAAALPDVEALLKDRRTLGVVLEAFQLEGEIDKRALLRKVMTEDPKEARSLANRLTDPRWRQLAAAFGGRSGPPLAGPALVDRLLRQAMTNRYEKSLGESNPGLREAVYFSRKAAEVTSVPQLMSDKAMLAVARGALGLPEQFGLLEYEQQRDVLTRRLDVAQLQDPKAVARIAQRYLAGKAPAEASSPALALFGRSDAGTVATLATRRLSLTL